MPEITLEALATRLEAVEKKVESLIPAARDWRSVVGISEENEFTRAMYADMEALREADRKAAREGVES